MRPRPKPLEMEPFNQQIRARRTVTDQLLWPPWTRQLEFKTLRCCFSSTDTNNIRRPDSRVRLGFIHCLPVPAGFQSLWFYGPVTKRAFMPHCCCCSYYLWATVKNLLRWVLLSYKSDVVIIFSDSFCSVCLIRCFLKSIKWTGSWPCF